jgi:hypothetical protein
MRPTQRVLNGLSMTANPGRDATLCCAVLSCAVLRCALDNVAFSYPIRLAQRVLNGLSMTVNPGRDAALCCAVLSFAVLRWLWTMLHSPTPYGPSSVCSTGSA